MQPNNTNRPPVQWTLLTPDNGQVSEHKRIPCIAINLSCTDKRCGYKAWLLIFMLVRCYYAVPPVAILKKMATVGPELQVVETNSFVRGYHAYQEKWNPVIGESLLLRREPGILSTNLLLQLFWSKRKLLGIYPSTLHQLCHSF